MAYPADNKTCAICSRLIESGQGQAIFTAECAHSFHFSCIGNSVTYGNYLCPVCPAKWNDLPYCNTNDYSSFGPNPVDAIPEPQVPVPTDIVYEPEPILFSDDEPLPMVTTDPVSYASPGDKHNITVEAIPERVAVASSESVSEFSVLVKIIAPYLSGHARAPIDLVAVLDVSGSMHGPKLALLKSSIVFVIDMLGPCDRLSIVAFSTRARRILPLHRMTERGRENSKRCVESLNASDSTNIVEALEKGVKVLEERRHQDQVSSIIFLSDGRDTCYRGTGNPRPGQPPQYLGLLPASINPKNRRMEDHGQLQTYPVHTFGFGADHNPLSMRAISDASGGHFSFSETYEKAQDDLALCISFLECVLAQELLLILMPASHGVQIRSISGLHAREISTEASRGLINVGDLYAEEEQEYIVNLSIPVFRGIKDDESDSNTTMPLLDIYCSYIEVMSNDMVQIDGDQVTIRRPKSPSPLETTLSLEVDGQRSLLSVEQGMKEAQQMAETGDLTGAHALLSSRRSALVASASWQAESGLCRWLEHKMKLMEEEWK